MLNKKDMESFQSSKLLFVFELVNSLKTLPYRLLKISLFWYKYRQLRCMKMNLDKCQKSEKITISKRMIMIVIKTIIKIIILIVAENMNVRFIIIFSWFVMFYSYILLFYMLLYFIIYFLYTLMILVYFYWYYFYLYLLT